MDTRGRSKLHLPPAVSGFTPWLVFPHGKSWSNQTFCSVSSILDGHEHYCLKSIPELRRKRFMTSCQGWIVLCGKDDHKYFLWNPVTLETIKLPPWVMKLDIVIRTCILSSPPDDSSCTILLFVKSSPLIIFCRPGDEQWSLHNYEKDLGVLLGTEYRNGVYFRKVVALTGKLYAVTSSCPKMVIIEIDKPRRLTMKSLEMKRRAIPPASALYSCSYLVESSGELLVISKGYRGMTSEEVSTITVHRLDFSQMDWVEVKSLNNQMIFLGEVCAVSCPATPEPPGFVGCRIYFTMEGDRSLYSFNLEDNSVSVSLPCPHLPTPWSAPFWVMPDLRLMRIGGECEQNIKNNEEYNWKKDAKGDNECDHNNVMEEQQKEPEGHFANLNLDILSLISDYLSLFDYLNFRATCRIFQTAAPPLSRNTIPLLKLKTTLCATPWLMFLKNYDNNGIGNFTFPMKGDIPELLLGTSICCSKDGWFLTSSKDLRSIFFFNPLTRETGKYRLLPKTCIPISGIGLSAEPTSTECVTVAVSMWGHRMRVCYFRDGMQDWCTVIFSNIQPEMILTPSPLSKFIVKNNPVFYDNAFYLLGQHGNLGVLKVTVEGIWWEVLAKPQRPCKSFHHSFLVPSDHELLSVFVGHLGKWVRVYRLNRSMMVWIEVKSLPNHTLFVSNSSSFSALASLGAGNRIYFPRFRDESILYYSLETKLYHSVGHADPLDNFYGTTEPKNCGWFEPRLF